MTNEQLVAKIKAGEDVAESMEALYNQVRRFIHATAWKYRDSGELEDLEQEGYLALYPAIEGYDPEQGAKFLTYAEYHISQRMRRYLQRYGTSLRLPVHCQERQRIYNRFCSSFKSEYGREPTDREAAAYLDYTHEQIRSIRRSLTIARVGSLDSPVAGMDGSEDTTVGDMVASAEDLEGDALERIQDEQLKKELWSCVDALDPRQADVMRRRYTEGKTLKEIGQDLGMTVEAVRQIHNKALRELRKPIYSGRLRHFLEEAEVFSINLEGGGTETFNRTWTSSTERAAMRMAGQEERFREYFELLGRMKRRGSGLQSAESFNADDRMSGQKERKIHAD